MNQSVQSPAALAVSLSPMGCLNGLLNSCLDGLLTLHSYGRSSAKQAPRARTQEGAEVLTLRMDERGGIELLEYCFHGWCRPVLKQKACVCQQQLQSKQGALEQAWGFHEAALRVAREAKHELGETQMLLKHAEDARDKAQKVAQDLKQGYSVRAATAEKAALRLHAVCAAVKDVLTCPISQEGLQNPVMASDGFTYEKASLERWLSTSPTSPMTRQPIHYFSRNQLAASVAELLGKGFEEAASGIDFHTLHRLIEQHDSRAACRYLNYAAEDTMNMCTACGMSLLHHAAKEQLIHVCDTILSHHEFRLAWAFDDSGNSALHYAAAAGLSDLCSDLLARLNGNGWKALRRNHLGFTPVELAMIHGHHTTAEAMKARLPPCRQLMSLTMVSSKTHRSWEAWRHQLMSLPKASPKTHRSWEAWKLEPSIGGAAHSSTPGARRSTRRQG